MTEDTPAPFGGSPSRRSDEKSTLGRYRLAGLIVLATVVSIAGWSVSSVGLGESGLYFIAIPGLAAAAVTALPSTDQTEAGRMGVFRTTLVVILCSALLIREGIICVLMASPLVFLIVGLVGFAVAAGEEPKHRIEAQALLPLLLLGAFEGVAYDFPTTAVATEVRVVDQPAMAFDLAFAGADPALPALEPLLFQLPFPTPTDFDGAAAETGDRVQVSFTAGAMELAVAERSTSHLRLEMVSDTTPIGNWYAVDTIDIRWDALGDQTELSVSIAYERHLAPAFYFHPLGTFGVGEFAEVIADMAELNADEVLR